MIGLRMEDDEVWRPRLNPKFVRQARRNNKLRALRQVKEMKKKPKATPNDREFDRILERICRVCGVSRQAIFAEGKMRELVFARQAIFYWARRKTNLDLPRIGELMGGRHHTTVMQGRDVYTKKRAKMGRTLREVKR